MFDIKIMGGQVLDGTGSPAVQTDIGVKGDQIADVGMLSTAQAKITVVASGKHVCPGFIDAHSHSDTYLLIEPSAHSKIFQGITTEIVGNCGASAAPLIGNAHMPTDWREKEYPAQWSSVAEYRQLLEKAGPALNVALLIGHNTLRTGVSGYENRPLTALETKEICRRFEQALDEGGRGLSTGLLYAPGMFAPREELIELTRIAARHDGIYTSHMRNEGKGLLDAIDETIGIGKAAECRVEISHLKTSGKNNWHLIDQALEIIRTARKQGVEVCADRYPYTYACTDLDAIFPHWAEEGGRSAVLGRLRTAADRKRLREDLLEDRPEDYWGTIVIGSTSHPANMRFRGMRLTDVAKILGMEPVDAVLHLAETDELRTSAFFSGMCEDNMMRILAEPYVMIGTDASLRAPTGVLGQDYPHPRAYGSFPRFLRLALDGKTVPLPEAVRKMTSLPARQFDLKDRGTIAIGSKADIIVFDAPAIHDTASYSNPHQSAKGIAHVIVNGIQTISDEQLTGRRAGKFL